MRRIFSLVVAAILVATATGPAAADASVTLPVDTHDRLVDGSDHLGVHTNWHQTLLAVINPDDYECDANTPVRTWAASQASAVSPSTMAVLGAYNVFVWPAIATVYGDLDSSDDTFGVGGAYTKEMRKRHRDAQRFWDQPIDEVMLNGLHGRVIADDDALRPGLQYEFGVSANVAQSVIDLVQHTIENDPTIDYDNPLLTFMAFASLPPDEPIGDFGVLPERIVIGDGILAALEATGFGRNGPDQVHAHEVVHHVQSDAGLLGQPRTPESIRRIELMADALAAYNLAHARGASFQTWRVDEAPDIAALVGDCNFDSINHHGTPAQRAAAITWGARTAETARPQGNIAPSTELIAAFDDHLGTLIAPDAN